MLLPFEEQCEASTVDVLALEAIRVFLPDVFTGIAESRQVLTTTRNSFVTQRKNEDSEALVSALLNSAGGKRDIARSMIFQLFPSAEGLLGGMSYGPEWSTQWQRDRRVAHSNVLAFYLERVADRGLEAFWAADSAFRLLIDSQSLDAYFRELNPRDWEDTISALESFEEEFPAEAAEPASVVLLNLLPAIPERPRGIFDFDARQVVERVVLRLFRRLSPEDAEKAVRAALPQITSLFGKLMLLRLVGHEENVGHGLISPTASAELELSFREEVRSTDQLLLAAEPQILHFLLWTMRRAGPSEPTLELTKDPILGAALLKGAISEERSTVPGSRNIRVEKTLNWETLVELVGGEEHVRRIVEDQSDKSEETTLGQAIGLAKRYLAGNPPGRLDRLD
jgi:hypothetical protein